MGRAGRRRVEAQTRWFEQNSGAPSFAFFARVGSKNAGGWLLILLPFAKDANEGHPEFSCATRR